MRMNLRMLIVVICSLFVLGFAGHLTQENEVDDESADVNTSLPPEDIKVIAPEKAIQKIEGLALTAQKYANIDSMEDADYYYNAMVQNIDDIILSFSDTDYAYQFLREKGINRVVSNNLGIDHPELRSKLMVLLKLLFDIAPVTTNAVVPKSIVTSLLDIFENNNNLALKAHALDILSKWLPDNPEMQMRVMKLKGLDPFYKQIHRLDITVMQTMLDFFNTILKEHVVARNGKAQVTKLDHDRGILYRNIGLLERIETSNVCNALVNIFQTVWDYNDNGTIVTTLFELVKNTKPFCGDILKGRNKALALFESLLKFVKNEDLKLHFEDIGLNATEFQTLMQDYIDKVKPYKDEF